MKLMFKLFTAIFEVIYDIVCFYIFVCPGLGEHCRGGEGWTVGARESENTKTQPTSN